MKTLFALALFLLPNLVSAQLLSYESFTGIATGNGLTGSGSDAFGWNDTGWSGGNDVRFQVVDPVPRLTFQPVGGLALDGGNRAVQLTTSPEPVPGGLVATRTIPEQNTTLYASFLLRPIAIGTGSDSVDLRFCNGGTVLMRCAFQPDQGQQFLNIQLFADGGSGTGSALKLFPGQTYLVVTRLTRPSSNQVKIEAWLNPPANFANAPQSPLNATRSVTSVPTVFNTIGLGISSADTAGPATTVVFDDLRIGYTWASVVPSGPAPALVPDVTISPAAKLSWLSQTGRVYQVQYSYDLSSWLNLGSTIQGNNQTKEVLDSASDGKRFYRIQVQ